MAACNSIREKQKQKQKQTSNANANANALVAQCRMQQHVAYRRCAIEGGFVYICTALDS